MLTPLVPEFVAIILSRLKAAHHEAFLVGGAVRDALMGRPEGDWDVATDASPGQIRALFKDTRQFTLRKGTVTLVRSGSQYQITPYRGSPASIEQDLAHRDFTINALAYDPERHQFLDPFSGRGDMRRKLVRAVRRPDERFKEDPLRLLRAIRLASELNFRIQKDTLNAISSLAPTLCTVAMERIREELMKVLMVPKPSTGLNLMARTGLLAQVIPELMEGYLKRQNGFHQYTVFKHVLVTVDEVEPDPVLRLAALLHDVAKPRVREKVEGKWRFLGHEEKGARMAGEILQRLRFSGSVIQKTTHLIRHHMIGYTPQWSDTALRRWIRRVGPENLLDLIRLRHADREAHGRPAEGDELLREFENRMDRLMKTRPPTRLRDLPINGHDVMRVLGLAPGPEVGRILRNLMDMVTAHPERNDREHLRQLLQKIAES
jgi:poly(A) polymerase/tRNA nucleotidyltransferase (CCA-adding enzyme)